MLELFSAPSNFDWITVAALAAPHFLYAFIWYMPHLWMRAFGKKSVNVFETTAWLLKGVQFSTVAYWFLLKKPDGIDFAAIHPLQWVAAALLAAGGQALNAGIYRAIGHAGVYYGFKLGHKVPWVDGFPFNVVSHPQYVGSVMSVWSAAVLLCTQGVPEMTLLACYWTLLYVLTGWMESGH